MTYSKTITSLTTAFLSILILCLGSPSCQRHATDGRGQAVLPDLDSTGGADNVFRSKTGHQPQSIYVPQTDFYEAQSQGPLTILSHFTTMQQTTEWSCGNVAALMVLRHLGLEDETEATLALKMHTHTDSDQPHAQPGTAKKREDFGTSIGEMWHYFNDRTDLRIVATSYRPHFERDSLLTDTVQLGVQRVGNLPPPFHSYAEAGAYIRKSIALGQAIIVCWNEWGGHWTDIIGYDDGNTSSFFDDDLLIMADPYDTFDRKHDGYVVVSLPQFFYNWYCTLTPKPWQLQPFIIVDKA